jgi:hypothetical protein
MSRTEIMKAAVGLILAAMFITSAGAFAQTELKTCSANRAYCAAEAKKQGWTKPQCAEAFSRCMRTGEWATTGPHGRTVGNVQRR